MPSADQ